MARYRERGPYDMVLAELRLPGLAGTDLAKTIRLENLAQRIVMITDSVSVGRHVQRELGDIPILNLMKTSTAAAFKEARMMRKYEEGEGKTLIDCVEAGIASQITPRRQYSKRQDRGTVT